MGFNSPFDGAERAAECATLGCSVIECGKGIVVELAVAAELLVCEPYCRRISAHGSLGHPVCWLEGGVTARSWVTLVMAFSYQILKWRMDAWLLKQH